MAVVGFAERPTEGSGHTVSVPEEIQQDMEAAWQHLKDNPDQEGSLKEEDDRALDKYLRLARIYLANREGEAVTIRRLPSSHLPAGQCRFTMYPTVAENATAPAG